MKGKGKWAVLLLALGLTVAGCVGSSKSSDESAVAAKDNPTLGVWQVTVDPGAQKIDIEPITLGASDTIQGGNTLGNDVGRVNVTDLVNKSSVTNEGPYTLNGTTTVTLAQAHIIPGSEIVTKVGVKMVRGTDYTIQYFLPLTMGGGSVIAGSQPGKLARVSASVNLPTGSTVRIEYGYRTTTNQSFSGTTFTTDIMVENHMNATIEKLRSWTGKVSGLGGPAAQIGDGTTSTGRSNYPLLQPQTGGSYEKPSTTPQNVAGWSAGMCYNAWGDWQYYNPGANEPKIEGCVKTFHPTDPTGTYYRPAWLDPVCGRVSATYKFANTNQKYKFYMELTGKVEPWSQNNYTSPGGADPRFDKTNYSTWYAMMSYLVPDGAGLSGTWCNSGTNNATSKFWWAGSMVPIRPGSSNHCGTLITDPHMPKQTYFAVNFGLEYADTIEKQGKAFWDWYIAATNPNRLNTDVSQGKGMTYLTSFGVGLIYDPTVIMTFTTPGRTGHGGSTFFPAGYARQCGTGAPLGTYCTNNLSTAPHNVDFHVIGSPNNATGYIYSVQGFQSTYAADNLQFGTGGSVAPYITAASANNCVLPAGMPLWAGQWGLAHYNSSCNLVTEGVDSDLDYWSGMVVFKTRNTVVPGDWSFIRFDQSDSNYADWTWNNNTASNYPLHDGATRDDISIGYCVSTAGGKITCPSPVPLTTFIANGHEMGAPNMPPGEKTGPTVRSFGCTGVAGVGKDDWTCGGHQYVVGVVCIQ